MTFMPVTLADVARAAGVANSTASMALAGNRRISKPTRQRVADAAIALGYRPDPLLTMLGHRRRRQASDPVAIAVLSRPAGALYYPRIVEYGRQRGFVVHLLNAVDFQGRAGSDRLVAMGVAGVLFGVGCQDLDWIGFERSRVPCIDLDGVHTDVLGYGLNTACFTPAFDAVRRLHALGYRRVGAILAVHNPLIDDDHQRIGGFLAGSCAVDGCGEAPWMPVSFGSLALHLPAIAAWRQQAQPDAVIVVQGDQAVELAAWRPHPLPAVALVIGAPSPHGPTGWLMRNERKAEEAIRLLEVSMRAFLSNTPSDRVHLLVDPIWQDGCTA